MKEAYEYAQKYIKISNLMDECMYIMRLYKTRSIHIESDIRLHEFNGKMDVLFYKDYLVLDHKKSWGEEAFGYNFVRSKSIGMISKCSDVIIFDPKTNIFYVNMDDIQSDDIIPYTMDFLDNESHMFQMELILGDHLNAYRILYALHMLGYDKKSYIYIHSFDVLDTIIEELERYIEKHRYN